MTRRSDRPGGLVGVQQTLTPVLKAKALDNRLPDPILGDEYAERVMRRLDPEYDRGPFGTSQLGLSAVVRAKAFDDWARSFLADQPDAVVLNLGCGLDARVHRIDPPATVDWYDLDFPAVIELRRELLPAREHYTLIGSSVTELSWLDPVPRGRPVLYNARFRCGFDDPSALAAWHPRLEYVDEAPMNDAPVLLLKAPPNVRRLYRVMNLLPGFRRSSRIVRFRF